MWDDPVKEENEMNTLVTDEGFVSREGRNRHTPIWVADYIYGKGLSEDENEEINMLLMATEDPTTFEEAV